LCTVVHCYADWPLSAIPGLRGISTSCTPQQTPFGYYQLIQLFRIGDVFQFRDEYVENRDLIGWNFYNPSNPAEQVDLVITDDLKGKKVVTVDTAAGPVRILGRRELIEMKRLSGWPQDVEDANALDKLS